MKNNLKAKETKSSHSRINSSMIADIRWDKHYSKMRTKHAENIQKILAKKKLTCEEKSLSVIVEYFIHRKNK